MAAVDQYGSHMAPRALFTQLTLVAGSAAIYHSRLVYYPQPLTFCQAAPAATAVICHPSRSFPPKTHLPSDSKNYPQHPEGRLKAETAAASAPQSSPRGKLYTTGRDKSRHRCCRKFHRPSWFGCGATPPPVCWKNAGRFREIGLRADFHPRHAWRRPYLWCPWSQGSQNLPSVTGALLRRVCAQ